MAFLTGYLNPTPAFSAFLIPLFAERSSRNKDYIQQIAANDIVESFVDFDIGEHAKEIASGIGREINIGEKALWAFQFDDGRIVSGTSDELTAHLRKALLSRREFVGRPLLESELRWRVQFLTRYDSMYGKDTRLDLDGTAAAAAPCCASR